MSHKTGKRVLTASTTLALAVVGLAASPMAAHAAAGDTADGCGLNDTVLTTDTTTYVKYSLDAGSTFTPITYDVNASGVKQNHFSLAGIPGAYTKDVNNADVVNPNFYLYTAGNSSQHVTGTLTKAVCRLAIGAGNAPADPNTASTLNYKAPTISAESAGVTGGTVTLYYNAGVTWTVTDNAGLNKVVTPDMFSAQTTGSSTYTVAATGSNINVTSSASNSNYVLNPPTNTWNFVMDGVVNIGTGADGVYTAATQSGKTISTPATANTTWKVTDTTVSGAALARSSGATPSGGTNDVLTSGQTKRYWLLANSGYAFADGSTYKYWDFSWTDTTSLITLDPASIKFNDGTGSNDSITVPSIAGLKFYVTLGTPSMGWVVGNVVNTVAAATANDKWLEVSGTTSLGADAAAKTATVVAVQDDAAATDIAANPGLFTSYDGSTTALSTTGNGPVYVKSPANFDDTKTTVTPAEPSYVDANDPNADSFTTPAFTPNVTYTITANGKASSGLLPGTTYTRQQWATVFPTLGGEVSQDVAFVVSPAAASASFQLPMSLTATVLNGAPWKKTVTVGSQIAAPAPTFIENVDVSGTLYDVIKFQNTANYTYSVGTWTDADSSKTWNSDDSLAPLASAITATTDANGVTTYYVANGVNVGVKVTPAAGVVLANADGFTTGGALATLATDKVFTNTFLSGNIITPVAPIVSDKAGTTDDTYTLVGVNGVTYYVNGQPFDMAKINVPQSTGGADKITVTATLSGADVFPDGSKTKAFPLTFDITDGLGDVSVTNAITSATPPTAAFEWGADGATSYTVTYHKVLENGANGPELPWLSDTDQTSANFVAMPGDKYTITVTAMNDAGDETSASSTVEFPAPPDGTGLVDIKPGIGTFGGSWDNLSNLMAAHNLPYFGDTAALGYTNSSWTVTLPTGSKSFDLYATVHQYGAKGKIQVNGMNWADFQTNSGYWGPVSDPYKYPVRTVSGWDPTKPVTIKVIVTENSANYAALDAYQAHK